MMQQLVEEKYVTQEWVDYAPKAFKYFYDHIGKKLAESSLNSAEYRFFPEPLTIFRAFNECPPDQIKVVILGQDPYFDGSATGLAFDNRGNKIKISPSLSKIRKEILLDTGELTNQVPSPSTGSHLGHLPEQGVLLINTALTVEAGKPLSHAEMWLPFTDYIIEALNATDNIIWIMWGAHAKAYKSKITNETHKIIEGTHPAARPNAPVPFLGGKYFSKANRYLEELEQTKINW